MKKYIAYHCHSDLSNLTVADSSVSPENYIERIKELGHTTYVSTEHGQSYGWAEKYLLCEKHNIKFVYGVEIYLEHNKKPYHCMLVAKNFDGLKQINHAINDAVCNNFVNRRPRVTMEMIEKYIDRNNVYCTTACFVKGTKVETKDGIKNIEEVQSGDYVLTHNNTWEEVNFPTTRHYCGDMITLGVDRTNKRITSTANHKYYTLDKKTNTPQWKEASELSVGDILLTAKDNVVYTYDKQLNFNTEKCVSKCKLKHCGTSIVLDEIDMITFGLWIGDGYISDTTSSYRVGFTFNIKEFDNYYESFVKKTMSKFKVEPYINIDKDSNKVDVTYYSKTLYYVFRDLFGKVNSETKTIPKKLIHISKEYDTAILFGYLLADGYFGYDRNKGGSVRSVTISEKLHTQIKSIYKTLGALPSEFVKNEYVDKNNVNHRQSYYLILHNTKLSKISKMGGIELQYNLFKENIHKTSTSKIILEINGREYFARKVKSIDKSKFDGSVYCLNVGVSHSFHCEDIIVHNCIMGVLSEPTYELFRLVLRHFGDHTLLEVQANLDERQIKVNKLAKTLSKKYNLKLIAGTDSHIIDNKQMVERIDLIAGKGINYGEDESEDGFFMDYPDYETLFQRFKKQGIFTDEEIEDFIDRTNMFEECEDIVLNKDFKVPTIYPELSRKERCEKLIDLVNNQWNQYKVNIPNSLHPTYIQEIKNELKEWFKCHMEDYALTSHAILKEGIRRGGVITKSGRGSAASYITNMLFGFTTIDRLKTKVPILQQRFMTADKILKSHSCPDRLLVALN